MLAGGGWWVVNGGGVCGLLLNRISVRFLMALVQWCSGFVLFWWIADRVPRKVRPVLCGMRSSL